MRNTLSEIHRTFVPLYRDYARITPSFRLALSSIFRAGFRYPCGTRFQSSVAESSSPSRRRLTFWTLPGGIEHLQKRFWYYDVAHHDEKLNMYHARMTPTAIMDVRLPSIEVYESKRIPLALYTNGRKGHLNVDAIYEWYKQGRLSSSVAWPLLHGVRHGDVHHFSLSEVSIPLDNFIHAETGETVHDLESFVSRTFARQVSGQLFVTPMQKYFVSRRDRIVLEEDGLFLPGGSFRFETSVSK